MSHPSTVLRPSVTTQLTQWQTLGAVAPTTLVGARVQLHHAAQVANAAAISLLPPAPDDSHTSFTWHPGLGALVSHEISAPRGFRIALRVAELALVALDVDDAPLSTFPLDGRAQSDAVAWLQTWVSRMRGDGARVTMKRHFQIPGAPPDAAQPWRLGAAFGELAAWYANADALLRAVAAAEPGAGPVRCWPHHFDIATLVEEPRAGDGVRHTTGIGLSPGDEYYAEPYFYVGPYPYPRTDALPVLGTGRWHRAGWVGAALPGSDVVAAGDAAAQARLVGGFVTEAVAAVRAVRAAAAEAPTV
jgi:hypothetical protein